MCSAPLLCCAVRCCARLCHASEPSRAHVFSQLLSFFSSEIESPLASRRSSATACARCCSAPTPSGASPARPWMTRGRATPPPLPSSAATAWTWKWAGGEGAGSAWGWGLGVGRWGGCWECVGVGQGGGQARRVLGMPGGRSAQLCVPCFVTGLIICQPCLALLCPGKQVLACAQVPLGLGGGHADSALG